MSKLLISLVALVTMILSGPVSPAHGQPPSPVYNFVGFIGANTLPLEAVPPGGSLDLSLSVFTIRYFCITEALTCELFGEDQIPIGTELISTDPTIASVDFSSIVLNSAGSTTLQVQRDGEILASYLLNVTPPPLYSFVGSIGSDESRLSGVAPGGVLEVSISNYAITSICFTEGEMTCGSFTNDNIPDGTQLISTHPDVASVSLNDFGGSILLNSTGATTLQLRQGGTTLASYRFVVTPVPPGTGCDSINLDFDAVVDCSGKCVSSDEVRQNFGNGVCDDGTRGVDLSCAFVPGFFLDSAQVFADLVDVDVFDENLNAIDNPEEENISVTIDPFGFRPPFMSGINTYIGVKRSFSFDFVSSLNRDGGDCSPEASCKAQFGAAPSFELCRATSGSCSFSARTGNGTCTQMCQQFGSSCVAAVDNSPAGCNPVPDNTDTCETPRNSAICFCERR